MANRWHYVSTFVLFTFLALKMALIWGTTEVGNNTKSADL